MLFKGRSTPHDFLTRFLLFKATDAAGAVQEASSLGLRFLIPDVSFAQREIMEMRKTMPQDLAVWHEKGEKRKLMPPDRSAAAWTLKYGIHDFYRYQLLGTVDEFQPIFRETYSFLHTTNYRIFAEAMSLGKTSREDMEEALTACRYCPPRRVLDVYFQTFYDISPFSDDQLLVYVGSIATMSASGYTNYQREAQAKRFAILNPSNSYGQAVILGMHRDLPNDYLMKAMKSTAFRRMILSSSPTIDAAELEHLNATNEVYGTAVKSIASVIQLEREGKGEISANRKDELLLLMDEPKKRMAQRLAQQIPPEQLESNHLPPTPKIDEGDVS